MSALRRIVFASILVFSAPTIADVAYVVNGLDETLEANVLAHVDAVQFGPSARLRPNDHEKVIDKAVADARAALRPYGYYAPDISARIIEQEGRSAIVELSIDAGPPIRIASVAVDVAGPGATDRQITSWRRAWPLGEGAILDQSVWEDEKLNAIETARSRGYLAAGFTEHSLALDLERGHLDHEFLVFLPGSQGLS